MVASEEGDPNAVEAEVGDPGHVHIAVDTKNLHPAAETGKGATDGQRQYRVQTEPHAGVVRGARREADRAQLEAPARSPQQQVDHHGGQDRDKEAVVSPTQGGVDRRDAGGEVYRLRTRYGSLLAQRVLGEVVR